VLYGSRAKPIFVGLGTAAILAVSGATVPMALADPAPTSDPTPTPSESAPTTPPPSTPPPTSPPPSTSPPTTPRKPPTPTQQPRPTKTPNRPAPSSPSLSPSPSLSIGLSLSSVTVAPGGSVTATVRVSAHHAVAQHAVLSLSAPSADVSSPGGLGNLGSGGRAVSRVVKISTGHAAGTVTVTAAVSADRASTRRASGTITVTVAGGAIPPGGAAGGGISGGVTPPSLPGPGVPGAPRQPGPLPEPQLPMVAQPPSVAPELLAGATPVSLRANSSPLGLDPTSYRLVWTEVAWLSALIVGVSLLLTQLRLKRRRHLLAPVPASGARRASARVAPVPDRKGRRSARALPTAAT
jgi:hypothetical protein